MPELYDAHYFAHSCGTPYRRVDHWLEFYDRIAARIVDDIGPKTVLDAGCAMGFLIEGLRKRGVEAYGVDVSEYAIGEADASIRDFVRVASVTDELNRDYDLIVCIEVLEHLTPDEADAAISNFSRHAGDVLFSSTPFDFVEATHINVQTPDRWASSFARHGFLRDVDFDASFVTEWARRFRSDLVVTRSITEYERNAWRLEQENQALRQALAEQREAEEDRQKELAQALRQAVEVRAQLTALRATRTFRYTAAPRAWWARIRRN